MSQSTRSRVNDKPRKPYQDFPLFPHTSGRWAKKVRGKLQYFGRVGDDPEGESALALWEKQKDDLLAGRVQPRGKRTAKSKRVRKPYPEFPLTIHGTGRWCKKHQGTTHYFGPLEDWKAAFAKYEREWPYIIVGRAVPTGDAQDGCTMRSLCNEFLNAKRRKKEAGELSLSSFSDYVATCDRLIEHFKRERRVDDLRPTDYGPFRSKLANRYGVVMLRNEINRCRMVFKFAFDNHLIDRPVSYGQEFDRPSMKVIRQSRQASGQRIFAADDLRRILDALDGNPFPTDELAEDGQQKSVSLNRNVVVKAMTFLGINCGMGQSDCANLQLSHIDLETGWIEYPRPKTAIERRIPLWVETVEALREAVEVRPAARDDADAECVFLTKYGRRWVRVTESRKTKGRTVQNDALAQQFAKVLNALNINGRRGLNFYALRHNFQTIGGNAKDPDAVAAIMGHVDSSMGAVYRERISDSRLLAVVDVIKAWLWPADYVSEFNE